MLSYENVSPRSSLKHVNDKPRSTPKSQQFQRIDILRNSGKNQLCSTQTVEDINSNNEEFTPPNPELAARIVEQVEFYFSDVNILKDTFLLQHMKHNKEGYISLKLLSGFKRIKHLVKNWRELAYALENGSELLKLNNERTKIRRIAPLPTYDITAPYRTVVAFDLPLEKPITIKSVANVFAPCGKIVLVRILLPKNPIPADIRQYIPGIPELQQGLSDACALIEFSDFDSVQCALQRRPACAQAAPLVWGSMRVKSLVSQTMCLDETFARTPHRASLNEKNRSVTPALLVSPILPRQRNDSRRHSCPIIQYTPTARRRRSSVILPDNVIRLPRGPDGSRGFRDRCDLSSSD